MLALTTALLGLLTMISGLFHHAPPQKFGGIATCMQTIGMPLYDTPSGYLDKGFYVVGPTAVITAHTGTTTTVTATTTQVLPDAIKVVAAIPNGATLAHVIGKRYLDQYSDGTSVISPTTDGTPCQTQ